MRPQRVLNADDMAAQWSVSTLAEGRRVRLVAPPAGAPRARADGVAANSRAARRRDTASEPPATPDLNVTAQVIQTIARAAMNVRKAYTKPRLERLGLLRNLTRFSF